MFAKRSQSQFESSRHNSGGGVLLTKLTVFSHWISPTTRYDHFKLLLGRLLVVSTAEENVLARTIDLLGGQMTPHQVDIVLLRFSQQLSSW